MIFSMDEMGFENHEKINELRTEAQKWAFVMDTARAYGFAGIHITPSLYESFGLNAESVPSAMDEFHLSYHLGGVMKILSNSDVSVFEKVLSDAFETVIHHKMKDLSLHPPVVSGFTQVERQKSAALFSEIIRKWSAYAKESGFSLSVETHLYEPFFLFGTLEQYKNFYLNQKNMGILVDISHNYFSGYDEQEIIHTFDGCTVTALHVSDALRLKEEDLALGTHLAIGDGAVDYRRILPHFANDDVFAVLEIKASNTKLKQSLDMLKGISKMFITNEF